MRLSNPALRMTEIVSFNEARDIAKRDAVAKTSHVDKYVENNALAYYVLVNTWLLQIDEVNHYAAVEFTQWLATDTLTHIITICAHTSDAVIARLAGREGQSIDNPILQNLLSSQADEKTILQLLRYPKRFSPLGSDKLAEASITALIATNNRDKMMQRRSLPSYIVRGVRGYIAALLTNYKLDPDDITFSNGAADDSSRPLRHKLRAYSRFSTDLSWPYFLGDTSMWLTEGDFTVIPAAVPKSYKAARVIAPENVFRSVKMQQIRHAIERSVQLSPYCDLLRFDDQTANQEKCFDGSVDCFAYTTIDLSSASDSVTKSHLRELFPQEVVRDIDAWAPRFILHGGKRVTMQMLATSGAPVTFPCESVLFLATALFATEVVEGFTGERLLSPQVFGDDMIIDCRAEGTLMDFLEKMGFIVNDDKSYYSGETYKESCGVEYWHGVDVSTRYYPRHPIANDDEGLSSIISLQHRLYGVQSCRAFLVSVVRSIFPKMTSHCPGSECFDLWEPIPRFVKLTAPSEEKLAYDPNSPWAREGHYTLVSTCAKFEKCKKPCCRAASDYTQIFAYREFLKSGPRYACALDELLSITEQQTFTTAGQGVPIMGFALRSE